ncbi:MAG TPA: glycoside hydrolase family 36 protein [Candidatus Dormibacteraeota bacterium]|nr:glycoside hydrolase family 36 protein [Candidatus Dormibacteraeota bacterium]
MTFRVVAELPLAGQVYAEGWQTWSDVGLYRPGQFSPRARDARAQVVMLRPGKPVPEDVIQAEGVLAATPMDGPARAWFAPEPAREVATLRLSERHDRWELTADGPVEEVQGESLLRALETVGDRLRVGAPRRVKPGWSTWSYYFKDVTEKDVIENLEAARRMGLPVEVAQLDDGYETEIGDWLDIRPGFGSLERLAARIRDAGVEPGIWIPPFMVSPKSTLAQMHPDWLVPDIGAGEHWGVEMRILDVANAGARDHIRHVFETFLRWGYTFFKLDFLYAAALPGIERYRDGMQLIRDVVGTDSTLLIGGAPLLPSIGLCDVMRVGPDVLPEEPDPQLDLAGTVRITTLRSWMNRRLWVNDPDCLVARPEIKDRETWAAHLMGYGGLRFSSDRLAALDARGLELTRRFLSG